MRKVLFFCGIVLLMSASTASTSNQRKTYSGQRSNREYTPSGRGHNNDPYAPNFPFVPFADPYEFHNALTQHIQNQHNQQTSAVSMTFSSPGANALATASYTYPDNHQLIQEQFARQQAFLDALQRRTQFQATAASGGAYAPNYATANAAFGNGNFFQSAAIHPANPKIPNVGSRFGGSSGSAPSGFHGVSTSAFSESSNVNGITNNRRGASTTINDNGKVTTFNVHS